jgi:hypothetical protein
LDIHCPRCGEPWETYYVYHEMTPQEKADLLAGRGCSRACRERSPVENDRTTMAQAALELCGDDLDGAAAMMEDHSI